MTSIQQLKPFHESVVDAINGADPDELETIGNLLKRTKIPEGHAIIAAAWANRCEVLKLPPNFLDVFAVIEAQAAAEKEEDTS